MSDNVTRLHPEPPQAQLAVNINKLTEVFLREYMSRHDVSVTEAVRRLLGVGDYILKAVDDGQQVVLKKHGRGQKVFFDL